MKVDLSTVDRGYFNMKACKVAGEDCVLVEPLETGLPKWNRDNLIFRSSLWTNEGELISAGFKKFFNWGEDLDADGKPTGKIPYAKPSTLQGCDILDKLDGSLLIISRFKGQLIVRTRATVDAAATLSNGDEIAFLKTKYPHLFADYGEHFSILAEWYSPRNKIVLNYGDEPRLWLVGAVFHENYDLASQETLDVWSEKMLFVPRPERYSFNSIEELQTAVEKLEGKEGVVAYPPDGQRPWKLKSARYLKLHYYKGDVATFDKIVDIWLELGQPGYQAFYDHLATKYDWEIAEYAKAHLSRICDASKDMARIVQGMHDFVNNQLAGLTRKEQYQKTIQSYGKTNRAAMVMRILDGKPLNGEQMKKLVLQSM